MSITHDLFCIVVLCMNVCVAVVESVGSGSVAVVSGIYYSYQWWLQAYFTRRM